MDAKVLKAAVCITLLAGAALFAPQAQAAGLQGNYSFRKSPFETSSSQSGTKGRRVVKKRVVSRRVVNRTPSTVTSVKPQEEEITTQESQKESEQLSIATPSNVSVEAGASAKGTLAEAGMKAAEIAVTNIAKNNTSGAKESVESTPQKLKGDVNGDGALDQRDLNLMKAYTLGKPVTLNMANADTNDDGVVDFLDFTRMNLVIKGIEKEWGPNEPAVVQNIPITTVKTSDVTMTIPGDVNGNGYIENSDFELLKQYFLELKSDKDIIKKNGDLNEDKKITITDVSKLKLMLIHQVGGNNYPFDTWGSFTSWKLVGNLDPNSIYLVSYYYKQSSGRELIAGWSVRWIVDKDIVIPDNTTIIVDGWLEVKGTCSKIEMKKGSRIIARGLWLGITDPSSSDMRPLLIEGGNIDIRGIDTHLRAMKCINGNTISLWPKEPKGYNSSAYYDIEMGTKFTNEFCNLNIYSGPDQTPLFSDTYDKDSGSNTKRKISLDTFRPMVRNKFTVYQYCASPSPIVAPRSIESQGLNWGRYDNLEAKLREVLATAILDAHDTLEANLHHHASDATSKELAGLRPFVKEPDKQRYDKKLPDQVYDAFLRDNLQKMEDANILEYQFKGSGKHKQEVIVFHLNKQISNMIANAMESIPENYVKVGGTEYTIHYVFNPTEYGLISSVATVTWKDTKSGESKSRTLMWNNMFDFTGKAAIKDFYEGLSKLNQDAWKNAVNEFLECGCSGIIKEKGISRMQEAADGGIDFLAALIKGEEAKKLVGTMSEETQDQLKSKVGDITGDITKAKLRKAFAEQVPNGKLLLAALDAMQKAKEAGDAYSDAVQYNEHFSSTKKPKDTNRYIVDFTEACQQVENVLNQV